MFVHSTSLVTPCGKISMWKPLVPNEAFAFIDITGEERIFMPSKNIDDIDFNNIRAGLNVRVLDVGNAPRPGTKRVTMRVESVFNVLN